MPDDSTTVILGDARPDHGRSSFEPGQLAANRYRIVRRLGRGGMGEVYEAEDLELHERVALKTILPGLANDDRLVARFKREIQLARRVTHPNVCRIFDVDFHGEGAERVIFVTMELLEGETLAAFLQRRGRIPPDEVLPIAKQLAAALDAAHAAGVVHRDFKPANVMLVGARAVVTDFGLAREVVVDDASHDSRVIGTPAYMAPEQVERGQSTAASDIYAFGIVLYEMLTGTLPFDGETALSALVKRLSQPPTSPRTHVPTIDSRWEIAILRCLERDPAKRFATASSALDPGVRRQSRRFFIYYALAAIFIVAIAAFFATRNGPTPPQNQHELVRRRSVAVLGFRNLSGRRESAWISTALSEMLSTELAAGGALRIIPGEQVVRAKRDLGVGEVESHSAETLSRIRENLASDYVVLGSYLVLANGEQRPLRLDLRIQDAKAGETIESFTVQGDERAVLELVSNAGGELRRRLGVNATPSTKRALPDDRAAQLYAEGVERLRFSDARAAVELLKLAVEADPDSTRAHAALASAWLTLGYDREGREAAKRAFDLATGLPREEVLFAEARYREAAKEWDRAIVAYRTLFDFYPDNVEYGLALANVQSSARKGRDALTTIDRLRMMSNDPRVDLAEAEAARTISDFVRQREAAKRAAQKAEAMGAKLLVARGYAAMAFADRNTNAPDSATANARRALTLFEERGDPWGVAASQNIIASVEFDRGHLTTAREWWEKMLVTSRTTGDRSGIARGLNNTALAMLHKGDLDGAEPRSRETLEIARAIGDNTSIARALNNLAEVPYLRGELDRAMALDEESLTVAKLSGDRSLVANVIFDIGDVELARGNLRAARERHDEALAMRRAIGDLGTANESLLSLGEIALAEGNAPEAERLAREVGAATKGKRRDNERASLVLLARALLAQNRAAEGEPVVRAAVAAARDTENARVRLSTQVLEAQFARDRGRLESIAREAETLGLRLLARDARRAVR